MQKLNEHDSTIKLQMLKKLRDSSAGLFTPNGTGGEVNNATLLTCKD